MKVEGEIGWGGVVAVWLGRGSTVGSREFDPVDLIPLYFLFGLQLYRRDNPARFATHLSGERGSLFATHLSPRVSNRSPTPPPLAAAVTLYTSTTFLSHLTHHGRRWRVYP